MRYVIAVYVLAVIGVSTWLVNVFGPHNALRVSLLLAIPLIILVRLQYGATKPLKREYLYTMLVAAICISTSWYFVTEWFFRQDDVEWRWVCECQPFVKDVKSDPRFVDVVVTPSLLKGIRWIYLTGRVKTDDDYEQLKILFEQRFHRDGRHHIDVYYPGKYR